MATSIEQLMVTADHVVPVEPLGGTATVLVNSGDVVYYNDNRVVDATHNIASIAKGASAAVTVPTWLKSAGLSSVTVTTTDPASAATTTTTTTVAATPVQRVPYSTDSPFNLPVLNAPVDATSAVVIAAISANQINANSQAGIMSTATDPTTQFALPIFDGSKAVAKAATGETGVLPVYVAGVFSQVLSRTAPVTRTNSYSQEISVPANWGDLTSDGGGDNNAEVINWATGEEWIFHTLAPTVSKLLPAVPTRQTIGAVTNVTVGQLTTPVTVPSGGVPQGCLVTVVTGSHTNAASDETTGVTDSRGNTYAKAASALNTNTNNRQQCDIWYSFIATALLAGDTISVATIDPNVGEVIASWYTNTQGGSLDVAAASTTATASVTTTAPNDIVVAATSEITSAFAYAAPWIAGGSTGAGDPDGGFLTDAYLVQATAGTVTTPNAGTGTTTPNRCVAIASFKLSAAVQVSSWPVGATLLTTNSPVYYANTDKLRVGTPGGANWETVTLSAGANVTTDPVTISALANAHPSGDLVIDCWTTTDLSAAAVSTLTVPRAAAYLNNGPQHMILGLGEANQETVLISTVVGTTVTLASPTTKTHPANCSIAAISASNVAYAGVPTGVNYDGVPPRSSSANSQLANSGSGLTYLAGAVTAFDAGQGVINHAIGIVLMDGAPQVNSDGTFNATGSGPAPYYVLPATSSDQNAPGYVASGGWLTGQVSGTQLPWTPLAGFNYNQLLAGEKVVVGYGTVNAEQLTIQTLGSTTIAAGSNGAALPQATVNVVSTTNFPATGTFYVVIGSTATAVAYTGKTATTFTGCTGGTGTLLTGQQASGYVTFTTTTAHAHSAGEYVAGGGAVPMGTRFRLKQSYVPPAGKSALFYMIVDALKRYGCFFRDGSGHSKGTFESQITAQWGTGTVPAIVPADLGLIPLASLELLVLPS